MNFDIKIQKMLASNSKYNNFTKNDIVKSTHFVRQNYPSKTTIIDNILPNILANSNTNT